MPHAHKYVKQPVGVEAIQVHPSNKSEDLQEFCPSLQYTPSAGIHFPPEWDTRPVQEHPGEYFFSIQSREGRVYGYLYDWIIKRDGDNFWINSEAYFAANYKAV